MIFFFIQVHFSFLTYLYGFFLGRKRENLFVLPDEVESPIEGKVFLFQHLSYYVPHLILTLVHLLIAVMLPVEKRVPLLKLL